jgi:release factor glutamine methyltransferase
MLPVVAGVSYELLKLLAKSDNILFKILKAPGLLMQRLTTKQPTDQMVEVALMAFNTVQKMESDREYPQSKFFLKKEFRVVKNEIMSIIAPVTSEEAETDWILAEVTGKKRSELKLLPYITVEQYEKAKEIAIKRAEGRPLQYVFGYQEFYNVKLKVDERVLIPRPETEILAEEAIKLAGGGEVLDICTGSGAIALAIAKNSGAIVEGADISPEAIELARENAENNGLKVVFKVSDLFEAYKDREFNLITANPPYIKRGDIAGLQKEVRDYEPRLALDGGEDGFNVIRRIAKEAGAYLKSGGTILIEVGIGQAYKTKELFISKSYTVEVIKDLEGVDRIIKAIKGTANV